MKPFLQVYYRARNLYRRVTGPYPPYPPPQVFYQNLCEILDGDVSFKAAEFQGVFQLDPRSHLFMRYLIEGNYEPHLVRICQTFSQLGGDFLDLGANVGFFSILLAQQEAIRKVLAVEPVESTLHRLRKNIDANNVGDKVILFEGALLDQPGEITINIPVGNEEFATQGKMSHSALETMSNLEYIQQTAPAITLDHLVHEHQLHPCLLKIDTEGTEHLVFRGGLETLRRDRPVIIAELNDEQLRENNSSAREVMEMLKDCGYSSYHAESLNESEEVYDYGEALFLDNNNPRQQELLHALRLQIS